MIGIEIEDVAWTAALPDAEAIAVRAAEAALAPLVASPPPRGGRGRGGGVAAETGREASGGSEPNSACPSSPAPPPPSPTLPPSRGKGESSVTVLLTDDDTLADLNARFRGKTGPTNVLSFPAPETARPHLGDLALAYGVCAREAADQGKPLSHHLSHLVAHGVLHLVGYDHETEAEAEAMEGLERQVLHGLGVPDPYRADEPIEAHGR